MKQASLTSVNVYALMQKCTRHCMLTIICPVPLPQWFRQGTTCTLNSITQLEKFPSYLNNKKEEFSSSFASELEKIRYQKRPHYSNEILCFSLMMRYTSTQEYKLIQKEYNLPSFSFLAKLKSGGIDNIKSLAALKAANSISEDIVILYDEMYLEQCDEYSGGKVEGSDTDGNLYTGIVCFMIVGLKSSESYVIRAVPKVHLSGPCLKEELQKTLHVVTGAGFSVSMVYFIDLPWPA